MKKTIVMIVGFTLTAFSLSAQNQLFATKKQPIHQRLVEQLIMKSTVVMEHSYQVHNLSSGKVVDGNENESYGRTYSLGVITNGAIIVPPSYIEPWRFDPNFRTRDDCEPRSFVARMRNMADTLFDTVDFDYGSSLDDEGTLYKLSFNADYGFRLDIEPGKKKGLYVLYSAKKPLAEQPGEKVTCILVEQPLETTKGRTTYEMGVPPPLDLLLGGLYLVPDLDDYGMLTFKVVGILQQFGDRWGLVTFVD